MDAAHVTDGETPSGMFLRRWRTAFGHMKSVAFDLKNQIAEHIGDLNESSMPDGIGIGALRKPDCLQRSGFPLWIFSFPHRMIVPEMAWHAVHTNYPLTMSYGKNLTTSNYP